MKILFVSNLYPPEIIGGAETYLERLTTVLVEQGHQVAVFTTGRRSASEQRTGVSVCRSRAANIFPLADFPLRPSWQKLIWRTGSYLLPRNLLAALDGMISSFQPEIICTENVQGFPLALFDRLRRTNVPLVHTIHDYFFLCPRLSLMHRDGELCCLPGLEAIKGRAAKSVCLYYRSLMLRRTKGLYKAVIAPSRFILDAHYSAGLFTDISNEVIPLGSTFPIRPAPEKRQPGPLRLLSAGALSNHKGGKQLLDLPRVLGGPDFHFDIAGGGELEGAWRELATRDPRVRFHGFVTGAEKERLFSEADLFLLPSIWYDNSPVVIYESFSYGLPVIASDIGGIPELVRDGYNGMLVPPGDGDSLAAAVRSFGEDLHKLAAMRGNAYESSLNYSFDKHVSEFMRLISSITGAV
ncbi:MAG: glycosyltransferase family 4 protein [Pelobacteraceae bacterium]